MNIERENSYNGDYNERIGVKDWLILSKCIKNDTK
jgi:hypothetical protein